MSEMSLKVIRGVAMFQRQEMLFIKFVKSVATYQPKCWVVYKINTNYAADSSAISVYIQLLHQFVKKHKYKVDITLNQMSYFRSSVKKH